MKPGALYDMMANFLVNNKYQVSLSAENKLIGIDRKGVSGQWPVG